MKEWEYLVFAFINQSREGEWIIMCVPLELNYEFSAGNICWPLTRALLRVNTDIRFDVEGECGLAGSIPERGWIDELKIRSKWTGGFGLWHKENSSYEYATLIKEELTNGTYACVLVSQEITVSKQLALKDVTLHFFKDFLGEKVFKNSVAGIGPRKYFLISMPLSHISFCQYLWFVVNLDVVDGPGLTGVKGIGHAELVTVGGKDGIEQVLTRVCHGYRGYRYGVALWHTTAYCYPYPRYHRYTRVNYSKLSFIISFFYFIFIIIFSPFCNLVFDLYPKTHPPHVSLNHEVPGPQPHLTSPQ